MTRHLCPRCRRRLPPEEFRRQKYKGWYDAELPGQRCSYCDECERARYRTKRDHDRAGGGLNTNFAGCLLPAEPFIQWLERKAKRYLADPRHEMSNGHLIKSPDKWFAATVGMDPRKIHDLIHRKQRFVRLNVVDRALCYEGSTHIGELYPELYWDEGVAA